MRATLDKSTGHLFVAFDNDQDYTHSDKPDHEPERRADIAPSQIAAWRRNPAFDAALPDDVRAQLDAPQPAE